MELDMYTIGVTTSNKKLAMQQIPSTTLQALNTNHHTKHEALHITL
jgi:hypothetical protein